MPRQISPTGQINLLTRKLLSYKYNNLHNYKVKQEDHIPSRHPPILHLIHYIRHIHGGDSVGYQNYRAISSIYFNGLEDDAFVERFQVVDIIVQYKDRAVE